MLRGYGVKPVMIRIGKEVSRGYAGADFREALKRYVPGSEIEARSKEVHRRLELRAEAQAEAEKERALAEQERTLAEQARAAERAEGMGQSLEGTLALLRQLGTRFQ